MASKRSRTIVDWMFGHAARVGSSWPCTLAKPALSLTYQTCWMLGFPNVVPLSSTPSLPRYPGLSDAFQIVAFLCLSHRLAVDQHIVQVLQVWQVCQPGFAGWFQNLPRRKLVQTYRSQHGCIKSKHLTSYYKSTLPRFLLDFGCSPLNVDFSSFFHGLPLISLQFVKDSHRLMLRIW
jgi:hypothetical protein